MHGLYTGLELHMEYLSNFNWNTFPISTGLSKLQVQSPWETGSARAERVGQGKVGGHM